MFLAIQRHPNDLSSKHLVSSETNSGQNSRKQILGRQAEVKLGFSRAEHRLVLTETHVDTWEKHETQNLYKWEVCSLGSSRHNKLAHLQNVGYF